MFRIEATLPEYVFHTLPERNYWINIGKNYKSMGSAFRALADIKNKSTHWDQWKLRIVHYYKV